MKSKLHELEDKIAKQERCYLRKAEAAKRSPSQYTHMEMNRAWNKLTKLCKELKEYAK